MGPDFRSGFLSVGGVKLGVDGGFEGGWMREPYEEPWGRDGTFFGASDHAHRRLSRGRARAECAGVARCDPRGGRRRDRSGARRLRGGRRTDLDSGPAVDDRARLHPRPRTLRAHPRARPDRHGPAPPVRRCTEPRGLLGNGARGADDPGRPVCDRVDPGLSRDRFAGHPPQPLCGAVPLRHPGERFPPGRWGRVRRVTRRGPADDGGGLRVPGLRRVGARDACARDGGDLAVLSGTT